MNFDYTKKIGKFGAKYGALALGVSGAVFSADYFFDNNLEEMYAGAEPEVLEIVREDPWMVRTINMTMGAIVGGLVGGAGGAIGGGLTGTLFGFGTDLVRAPFTNKNK